MARPKADKATQEEPLEKQLWKPADQLRKNIDAAEYKHVVLGLNFLEYISDSFEGVYARLQAGEGTFVGSDPEDKVEYTAENVFFVSAEARWSCLLSQATQPSIVLHHMAPNSRAGVVLAKGSLISKSGGEGDVRRALVAEAKLIDCVVNLPAKLFLNTQIPACLWFMNRARENGHPRKGEILFIDARNLGHLINRRTREPSERDIEQIAGTYHAWRTGEAGYADVKCFCASVPLARVAELDHVLAPGRYVGLPDEDEDFNFAKRCAALKAEFGAQLLEEARLNAAIAQNLAKVEL